MMKHRNFSIFLILSDPFHIILNKFKGIVPKQLAIPLIMYHISICKTIEQDTFLIESLFRFRRTISSFLLL